MRLLTVMLRAPLLSLFSLALLLTACGDYYSGYYYGPQYHRHRHHRCHRGWHDDTDGQDTDGGSIDPVDPDAGAPPPECVTGSDCELGNACVEGACEPCPEGVCSCERDEDCSGDQVCNHPQSTCEPPPVFCEDITEEEACLARADCQAIYSGMNCTDTEGGECESGDPNCTCETFSFAVCVDVP